MKALNVSLIPFLKDSIKHCTVTNNVLLQCYSFEPQKFNLVKIPEIKKEKRKSLNL